MKATLLTSSQDSITVRGVEESATSVTPQGSILVVARSGILAHTLPVARAGRPVAFNQDIKAIQVSNDKVSSEYVYWFLRGKESEVLSRGVKKGATVHSLQSGFLEQLAIPLAPIEEQRRIVDLLSRAENIVRMRKEAEAKAKEIIPALYTTRFSGTTISRYNWHRLGDLLEFLTSGSRGWGQYYDPEGELFLRIQNVGRAQLLLDDVQRVRPPNDAETKRTRVIAGDVLLSITADLGRTAVIPPSFPVAYVNQHLAILRAPTLNPYFLAHTLNSEVGRAAWRALDRNAGKAGLNFNDIKSVRIPVPPREIQDAFSTDVAGGESIFAKTKAASRVAEQTFQSLLAGVFGEAQ